MVFLFRVILLFCTCQILFVDQNFAFAQSQSSIEVQKTSSNKRIVDVLERQLNQGKNEDGFLASIRTQLEDLRPVIQEVLKPILEEQNAVSSLLIKLGDAPIESAEESIEIADKRKMLALRRSELVVQADLENKLLARIQKLVDQVGVTRKEAFSNALFKRQSINMELFSSAYDASKQETISLLQLVRSWFSFISVKMKSIIATLSIGFICALAMVLFVPRWIDQFINRDWSIENPSYLSRLFAVLWSAIFVSAYVSMFLVIVHFFGNQFGLFTLKIQSLYYAASVSVVGFILVTNLTRGIFAPRLSQWRLLNLSDTSSIRISLLIIAIGFIYFADYFFSHLNIILSAPLSLTVVQTMITSFLLGILLASTALIKKETKQTDELQAKPIKWISIPFLIAGIFIVAAALTGYIGLARFASQQIVISGAILCLMFIGVETSKQLAREDVLINTRFGANLIEREWFTSQGVEKLGLVFGILMFLSIFFVGLPLLALQWGSQWEDVRFWMVKSLSGFSIGSITISFSDIFIGLTLFFIGIVITKLFKNWLNKTVLPKTKLDSGVRDSMSAGVSYVGIAIAAIIGVTSAGLDLSNFALVAGALSLGIGFGLQNIVSNFVSGLILLIERPIKVGDWIEAGNAAGFVKKISVRATEIETFNNQSIMLPNSELINNQVGNWTHKNKGGRIDLPVGVSYGANPKLVQKILYDIAEAHPKVLKNPEPFVFFEGFGESSFDFQLRFFISDITNQPFVSTDIRFAICEEFKKEKIEIPFPQRDLHVRSIDNTLMKDLVLKNA